MLYSFIIYWIFLIMKKIFLCTFFLSMIFSGTSFNKSNSWADNFNYDSLYYASLVLIDNDNVLKAIKNLNYIISKSKNKALILNSYYDLGQIYLSRSSNYSKSIEYFSIILNTNFSYKTESSSRLKSFSELKEKTLFMTSYVYHNHIGDLTKAQKYYRLFLKKHPKSNLVSSVNYELEVIDKSINNFNSQKQSN